MEDIDYNKELTQEQYESEEYKIGYANGVSSVLGRMQRGKNRGLSLDEIIEQVFNDLKNIF
jgi:hypothetical protein